jgi:hypothetical protein
LYPALFKLAPDGVSPAPQSPHPSGVRDPGQLQAAGVLLLGRIRLRRPPLLPRAMLFRVPPAGFIEPCLPSSGDKPPSGTDWVHEIKHDGYRLMARRDPITMPGGRSVVGKKYRAPLLGILSLFEIKVAIRSPPQMIGVVDNLYPILACAQRSRRANALPDVRM